MTRKTFSFVDFSSSVLVGEASRFNLNRARRQSIKYEMVVPSMRKSTFALIILADISHQTDLYAMTQPFQRTVWIFALIIMIILSFVFIVAAKNCSLLIFQTFKNYGNWVSVIFSVIMRQTMDRSEQLFKTWQASGLWLLWNLVCLVISYSYDGQLYSYLASEKYSELPNSLAELATSNLPIVTISDTYAYINGNLTYRSNLSGAN